jgi:iron only hydrogenase large subunit-like protein
MIQYPVYTKDQQCRDCYKCVGHCPVKAIRVQNGHPEIQPKMCVFCGKCVLCCPSKAIQVRNDLDAVKRLLASETPVYASLAPSFPAEFYDCAPAQIIAALKRLGFYAVSETALGADFVSASLAASLRAAAGNGADGAQKLFLSSACPAVVLYIKRYAPAFVPYLNDRASPLLAHAALLRKRYGKEIGVVFIGPCIAKKREADQLKEIDAALSYEELSLWFEEAGIRPKEMPRDEAGSLFVPRRAAKGAFYPVDGGMLISLRPHSGFSKTSSMVISGLDTIAETLNSDTFAPSELETPLFLELLACHGGCVNGPCMIRDASAINRRARLLRYAESADEKLDAESAKTKIALSGMLSAVGIKKKQYTGAEIRSALAQLGKYGEQDELNCSICGYESCRAFARALLDKHAEKTMCVMYLRNMARRKANALINAIPSGVVIVDRNSKIVECNQNFARLLGGEIEELYELEPQLCGLNLRKIADLASYFEDALVPGAAESADYEIHRGEKTFHLTVFVIDKGEIAAGVLDDITKPRIRRDKTVARARKIIDHNVKTVQKIAFLLGENAAETEAILHSIIESYSRGEKKK